MRVLFFSLFEFPDACAAATRVVNLVKTLQAEKCTVDVLGVTDSTSASLSGTVRDIPYTLIRMKREYGYRAHKRNFQLNRDLKEYLANQRESYDVIVLSNVYFDCAGVFLKYSKKHGSKIIVNAVEWYDQESTRFKGVRGKINLIKNRLALMCIHKKMGNILAISSLLDNYYKNRGCNTITIPTIVDLSEYASVLNISSNESDKLCVAYAGSPGRKDYIANAIRAIELLTEAERAKAELHFYGPEIKALYDLGLTEEFLSTYKENIFCHGRIPYAEVKEKIAAADFTVLLRPNKRYANAGFPTKVGESMACGTPVIANITSDLGKYIIDGKTGIVCANESPEACAEAFRRALAMTAEEKTAMRRAAYEMANTAFDYRAYVDKMSEFLNKVRM